MHRSSATSVTTEAPTSGFFEITMQARLHGEPPAFG